MPRERWEARASVMVSLTTDESPPEAGRDRDAFYQTRFGGPRALVAAFPTAMRQ